MKSVHTKVHTLNQIPSHFTHIVSLHVSNVYGSHRFIQIPISMHVSNVHGSYTFIQIPSHFTQFLTINHQNSTWKSLHVSDNIVHSEISHKYIHIMGWKDQKSKEIATCEKLDSLTSCCGQAAAGMVRAFPAHFVPLQSNSTHCNVHDSRAARENCVTCGISSEKHCWRNHWEFTHFKQATWNLYILHWNPARFTVHGSHTWIQIPSHFKHRTMCETCK